MNRSRRRHIAPEQPPAMPGAPPASWKDGTVVVEITDAGVEAIIDAAARHGLEWTPDMLHPRIAEVVAVALRRTPDWWVSRARQKA